LIELENAVVYHGSNLDVLPTLPDNSVDAIVTDPPYELGFMGKSWDSSGIAYSVELWAECLRVLKPGGHLLAFGGSRTWHRIAVAIEDAGFDVRDSIAWLYGSGFPKSLDISKAIDKRGGENITWFGAWLKKWREENNISQKEVAALFPSKTGNLTGCVANWELGFNLPTAEQFTLICRHFNLPFESLEEAEREVIGTKISGIANAEEKDRHTIGASKAVQVDITAPATDEAKKWQGWGTALKPAFEPIVVARKPLVSTVAANVLLWGVGGLNIDGSRIGTDGGTKGADFGEQGDVYGNGLNGNFGKPVAGLGRWPANIILDEYTAGLLDEQSGISKSTGGRIGKKETSNIDFGLSGKYEKGDPGFGDVGGASRFFYVAKASKKDRNEGLEDLEAQRHSDRENAEGVGGDNPRNRTNEAKQNFHPTVKPTALMEYLVKLVTPLGGTVLDPFTGSGSTGKAALLNGFKFIGIELTADYLPIIEGRLKHAAETYANQAKEEETKEQETLF
jgi:DNA modification methylase